MLSILENHKPSSFNWNMSINYSTNDNTVNSIYPGVNQYQLGGYDQIEVLAVAGAKVWRNIWNTIQRVTDPKDPNYGQLILDGNGLPQKAGGAVVRLGNQQANALLGLTNSFHLQKLRLSFLIDGRLGGKMFSGTLDNMERAGTAAITLGDGK